jgi:hypothetical protein
VKNTLKLKEYEESAHAPNEEKKTIIISCAWVKLS